MLVGGCHVDGRVSHWWEGVILVGGCHIGGRVSHWWEGVTLVGGCHIGGKVSYWWEAQGGCHVVGRVSHWWEVVMLVGGCHVVGRVSHWWGEGVTFTKTVQLNAPPLRFTKTQTAPVAKILGAKHVSSPLHPNYLGLK